MNTMLKSIGRTFLSLTGLSAVLAFAADEYSENWGPATGSQLPVLEAYDQAGRLQTLESLSGDQGLLLFLNRSADW
jgi:hypothetical protein